MINFCTKFHMPHCPRSVITIKPKGKKKFCTATILVPSFMKISELVHKFKWSHRQYSSLASLGNKSPNLADFSLHLVTKDIIPIYDFLGVFRIKLQRN